MRLKLNAAQNIASSPYIRVTGSKSESNRLLILQQQFNNLTIKNLSNSDDTLHLQQALGSRAAILDIGHAGTAMRFLTAFIANQPGRNVLLTGSARMKERPIGVLVDALRILGAQIEYAEKEGYPPLQIQGKTLKGGKVTVNAGVSSQFLTALLLIGSQMEHGLDLHLTGTLTSRPYLEMTTQLLEKIGLEVITGVDNFKIAPQREIDGIEVTVESDWSSAGYWYSWCALQEPGYSMQISSYKKVSLQGDSRLAHIYKSFGVETTYGTDKITITKIPHTSGTQPLEFDLTEQPDQAQTIFATCIGLGEDLRMTGLHTLRIKETDRIAAMKIEGSRFRESEITTTSDTLEILFDKDSQFKKTVTIDTYNDHRMALAFAPLCIKTELIINDAEVVSKSYGDYWNDLTSVNVDITEI